MKYASLLLIAICLVVTNLPEKNPEPPKVYNNEQGATSKVVGKVIEPQKTPSKPIALESKPEPLKVKIEIDNYKPLWDVEGNYSKALDRQSLITHLNGENHKFNLQKLNAMSTDDLQRLHDQDHQRMKNETPRYLRLWRSRR